MGSDPTVTSRVRIVAALQRSGTSNPQARLDQAFKRKVIAASLVVLVLAEYECAYDNECAIRH